MFTIVQTPRFAKWLDGLPDIKAQRRIATRLERLQAGHLGDCKAIGEGVSELRIDYGPGYRLYFTRRDRTIVILLCGGAKGTQKRDIALAKQLTASL